MSAEERRKILQMVADVRISAEESAKLMRALDESSEEEIEVTLRKPGSNTWPENPSASDFDQIRKRAMRFALIPLWIGVTLTVLISWWMFSIQQTSGLNFWIFCLSVLLMLGTLLIVLGAGDQTSRWLYVNLDRSNQNEWPRHITIGFPLGLASWFLKNFGNYIDGLKTTTIDEVLMAISTAKSIPDTLIVNMDECSDCGERVQVFIG